MKKTLILTLLLSFIVSLGNFTYADNKSSKQTVHKSDTYKKNHHYVIVYLDDKGHKQLFNTYAKSKEQAKKNLLTSRKVSKILVTDKRN